MIEILIAGDFCPYNRAEKLIDTGMYQQLFESVKPIVSSADYALVNLEAPILTGAVHPIPKAGPNLKASEKICDSLKFMGFDMATLANNHFRDYGDTGCTDTINALKKHGLISVGGGASLEEASKTVSVEIKGKKIAFINCCEREFSIADEKTAGSNPINPVIQYYAIQEAHKQSDYVIVVVHGGIEHYQLPTPRMQEVYRFFIDAGADAVINHHQHCYSGYEYYKGKPIAYGLGNFCFDWPNRYKGPWTEGYMAKLRLEESDVKLEQIPYIQCAEECVVRLMNDEEKSNFDETQKQLNSIIADKCKLKEAHDAYLNKNDIEYRYLMTPYYGRIMKSLFLRGILPEKVDKKKALFLYNVINCESHYERFLNVVKKVNQ